MNSQLEARPAENSIPAAGIEEQWVNALDCGALGPGREEPQLFYQEE
jgi:hypothetical protein